MPPVCLTSNRRPTDIGNHLASFKTEHNALRHEVDPMAKLRIIPLPHASSPYLSDLVLNQRFLGGNPF